MKKGLILKRGKYLKNYKPYWILIFDLGQMIFVYGSPTAKDYMKENKKHRIQISEETRIIDIKRNASKSYEDFTIKIGKSKTHLRAPKEDGWIKYFQEDLVIWKTSMGIQKCDN